jgi:nucleotide-binding universal stress UspA family protein
MGSAPSHSFDNIRPVLVPVEPARTAAEVAGAAAEVCAGLGAKAVLLDVKRSPDGMQREVRIRGGSVAAVLEDGACAHLKEIAGIFRAEGVSVDLAIREGNLVDNIVAEAMDTRAQLIVMGSRELTQAVSDRRATVVDEVIRFSQVPVMVVDAEPGNSCRGPESVLRLGPFKKVY